MMIYLNKVGSHSDNMDDTNTVQSVLNKASSDKFRMVLNLPPELYKINTVNTKDRSGDTINLNSLQFSVYGVSVPAAYVPNESVRFGGQSVNVTSYSRPAYPNITVGFAVDNKFINYYLLWKWLDLLNDDSKSKYNGTNSVANLKYKHTYMTDLAVIGKDEYNKDIVQFTYTNCFITRLEGFEYDHKNPEQIESKFEFAFSQFHMDLI